MKDCLFCKMVQKEIPTNIIYEDDQCIAFYDIEPKAPTHFLVIPKEHYDSLNEAKDEQVVGHLLRVASNVAQQEGLSNGYRIVINTGEEGGQTVQHLHVHVLGGRSLQWPPG